MNSFLRNYISEKTNKYRQNTFYFKSLLCGVCKTFLFSGKYIIQFFSFIFYFIYFILFPASKKPHYDPHYTFPTIYIKRIFDLFHII